MKHYHIIYKEDKFTDDYVHVEGPMHADQKEPATLCGIPIMKETHVGISAAQEMPTTLDKANRINCPRCIAIIVHCKKILLQEYN